MENTISSLTARDYLKVLFRHKHIIITTFVVVMLTVAAGLMLKTPVYTATVKMLVSAEKMVDSPYYRDVSDGSRGGAPLTQSEIVTSTPVMDMTVKSLGLWQKPLNYETKFATPLKNIFVKLNAKNIQAKLDAMGEDERSSFLVRMAVEDLKANINVEPIRDTRMFIISASDFSPVGAAIIANTVSRAYVIFDLEQQVAELQLKYGEKHPMVVQLKDNITAMSKNLAGTPLPNIEAIGPASVKIIEQADLPLEPSGPSRKMVFVLALFMALFLGVMLAFVFEYGDQTFKGPADIENTLGVPYLGYVMAKAKKEEYSELAGHVALVMRDKTLKTMLVTCACAGEGTSSVAFNIASNIAANNALKVLLIDANFRRPAAHIAFNVPQENGLGELIEGKIDFTKAIKSSGKNLSVMTCGKTTLNPLVILGSHLLQNALVHARNTYDIVIIDAPALSEFKDSAILFQQVDTMLFVVSEGRTRRQIAQAALSALNKDRIVGTVLNNRTFPLPAGIYKRV